MEAHTHPESQKRGGVIPQEKPYEFRGKDRVVEVKTRSFDRLASLSQNRTEVLTSKISFKTYYVLRFLLQLALRLWQRFPNLLFSPIFLFQGLCNFQKNAKFVA